MENDAKSETVTKKWAKSDPKPMPAWNKPFIWAALLCIAQFFVFAVIGVVRGYSVQSHVPVWILLGGIVLLLPCMSRYGWLTGNQEVQKWRNRSSLLSSFCIILISVVGMLQGRHHELGKEFYEQKNYEAAIRMYEKEINTWYLRLRYNYRENMSLFGMAQSYCQLGDFEQGRQTYQHLIKMSRGYYHERGEEELAELNRELDNIAAYKEQLEHTENDQQKAQILFDLAFSYRRIECRQKAQEQYALIQTLDAHEMQKDQAREFAADESW